MSKTIKIILAVLALGIIGGLVYYFTVYKKAQAKKALAPTGPYEVKREAPEVTPDTFSLLDPKTETASVIKLDTRVLNEISEPTF
jgi:flagellar basal body-associated protein FliL